MSEEAFKGYWHAAMATALGVAAAYNAMRLLSTKRTKNAVNVALYSGLCAYEWAQAREHWRDS